MKQIYNFRINMQGNSIRNIVLVLFVFLFSLQKLSAQINCTPKSGCAPLVGVQFTGLSGATNIQWNFGDGNFANINNPVHTYSSPGTYTITYTAKVGGSNVSQNLTVKVFGKPTPKFTYSPSPAGGCLPLPVSFTDQSTGSGGTPITSWQWSFGDGGVSAQQNPNYTYTLGGIFDVTLIVTDSNGCDSAVVKNDIIVVSPKPTVVITNTPLVTGCSIPYTINFNGTQSSSNSPLGGGLTYSWNFGNGQTDTNAVPPATTYTAQGSYTVSLTCTDNNNCSQTVTKIVKILIPVVKCVVPDTICLGDVLQFRDSSVAANGVTWDFGDGTPAQTVTVPTNVSHTYAGPGTYTVTGTAHQQTCTDVKTFIVVVEKATAIFSSSLPHFSCNPVYNVNYTNSSTGAATYLWSFSDGDTSTLVNPSHIWTQNSYNPYTIYQQLPLTATLTAISPHGCIDTTVLTLDSIHRPTAYFYTDVHQGCVPLTVTFTDSSFSGANITSYQWHFGDGSAVVSGPNDTIETHTYTVDGIDTAYLVIQNANGCIDTSFFYPITIVDAPNPSFTFSPLSVCPDQAVTINNLTLLSDSVDHWHVISDDGYFSGCINDPNPSWNYTHTGTHDISMVAYTHGCRGDTTVPVQVTVNGPIATGRFFVVCGDSSYKVRFDAELQDADYAVWTYGDGQQDTVTGNGVHTTFHTYPASGNYTAYLTGYNGTTGCGPYIDTLIVTVRKINASFGNQPIGCESVPISYDASATVDEMATCGIGYTWLFNNLPPVVTSNPVLTYPLTFGDYDILLIVKDTNECRDTARGFIKISHVTSPFTITPSVGCLPAFTISPVQTASSDTTITNYIWSFGNGSPTVNGPSPTYTYTAVTSPSQNFTVSLTVVNANGCLSSSFGTVTVNAPLPTITGTPPLLICAGHSVTFTSAGVSNATSYNWNFGDGSSITTATNTVTHVYTAGGTYTVPVTATDASGCQGTSLIPVSVTVQDYPVAAFYYKNLCDTTKPAVCAGCTIDFIDTSIISNFSSRVWNLGTGGSIVGNQTVGTTYTSPGVYPISLIVSTTFGCKDTIRDTITVYGGQADFVADDTAICKGDVVHFTIKDTVNTFTWHWDFGDGTDTTKFSPIGHSFNYHPPGGNANVSLVYWTPDSACRYSVVHPIHIYEVIADFDRNNEAAVIDSMHCIGVADLFTNTSQNASTSTWNFGDGSSSVSTISPNHTYSNPGTYTVTLNITDNVHGCKDTIKKPMVIFPPPVISAAGTTICAGNSSSLSASGTNGSTFVWHPGDLVSDSTIANPTASLSVPTTFTVTGTDINGCVSTATTTISVQQPPANINWDTTVIIGQITPIPGNAGSGFTYSWTPTNNLSCTTCPNPVSNSLTDITYTASVQDTMGCFSTTNTFKITVKPEATIDVPTAFTPNADGTNDVIYVGGWGLKKLEYFRVYNRWGQLLFESTDLTVGWDGLYKGVPQNMETYIYQVSAESYLDGKPLMKKSGYFKLIR